jgi:anion-transporting  ArsA/GET3 family ATPase
MQGQRVLCLTIDPARRLANSLGLQQMSMDEQEIAQELFTAHGLVPKGSLHAMMLDTKRTFDQLVERHASSSEARDRILRNKLYQYVSSSLAGTQEYMAMEKLHEVRKAGDWDLIVLDTPPSANALDFLDAPERLVGAIDSAAMRWFLQAFEATGKFSLGVVGRGASLLLKGLSKFTGANFLEQVAEFIGGLNDLFGGFRERARDVSTALRSKEVAFVVVTRPSPLAIDEALALSGKLEDNGMRSKAFVLNCAASADILAPISTESAGEALASMDLGDVPLDSFVAKLEQAHEERRRDASRGIAQAKRLRSKVPENSWYVEVPAFEQDVHDLGALAWVGTHLVGDQG